METPPENVVCSCCGSRSTALHKYDFLGGRYFCHNGCAHAWQKRLKAGQDGFIKKMEDDGWDVLTAQGNFMGPQHHEVMMKHIYDSLGVPVHTMGFKIKSPFTYDQVKNLTLLQNNNNFHGYTCGGESCSSHLVATVRGWICPFCDYTQDWAFDHTWLVAGEPT